MIFLIEYDRPTRRTLLLKAFYDADLHKAQEDRLRIELDRNAKNLLSRREVVLLEARTEEALHHTHARYFENLSEDARVLAYI